MNYTFNKKACQSIPRPFSLGKKGDFGTSRHTFVFDRYADGTDLSECSCYLLLSGECVPNGVDGVKLETVTDSGKIRAEWEVDNGAFIAGNGKLQFKFFRAGTRYVPAVAWYSDVFDVTVGESLYDSTAGTEWIAKGAKDSPRFEDGVLAWYEGDSFKIEWTLNITIDGVAYYLQADDVLTFRFFDEGGNLVYSMEYTRFTGNTFEFDMTAKASKAFAKGEYAYRAVLARGAEKRTTTIYAGNKARVE